jgi:hypothetical protein
VSLVSHPTYLRDFYEIESNELSISELTREFDGTAVYIFKLLLARSTEYGSRTLVHGGTSGPESHGQYLSDCKVTPPSKFVLSEEGAKTQKRVWRELSKKLEEVQPGILENL